MIHFGLYRRTLKAKICHMFVQGYHEDKLKSNDLCGTNMEVYTFDADTLDQTTNYKICEKCKLVYLMLELAE